MVLAMGARFRGYDGFFEETFRFNSQAQDARATPEKFYIKWGGPMESRP